MKTDDEIPVDEQAGDRDRYQDLYKGWRKAWSRKPRQSFFGETHPTLVSTGLFAAIIASIFLIPVDVILIAARPLEEMSAEKPISVPWRFLFPILLVLNSALLTTFLKRGSPGKISSGWRIGMALLFSLPWIGLWTSPLYTRLASKAHDDQQVADLTLNARDGSPWSVFRSPGRLWTQAVHSQWSLYVYAAANTLVVHSLWSLPWGSWIVTASAILLHAVAAGGLTLHALAAPRQDRADGLSLAELSFVVVWTVIPIPFSPLVSFFLYALAHNRSSQRSLLKPFVESRNATSHLPRWLDLQDALRRTRRALPWTKRFRFAAPDPPKALGESDRRLLTLYSIKSAALVAEAAAVIWLVFWLADGFPGSRLFAEGVVGLITVSAFLFGMCGILLMLIRGIQHRFRTEGRLSFLDRYPLHHFLAASSMAFSAGLVLGVPLYYEEASRLAGSLGMMGLCGTVVVGLRILLPTPGQGHRAETAWTWLIGFGLAVVVGFSTSLSKFTLELFAGVYIPTFKICIAIAPLILCVDIPHRYLGALLRPFGPDDIRNPAWPLPLRRALRFLKITATLPFGGLTVPAWIWIRYRYWPEFEREWQERVSRSHGVGHRVDR